MSRDQFKKGTQWITYGGVVATLTTLVVMVAFMVKLSMDTEMDVLGPLLYYVFDLTALVGVVSALCYLIYRIYALTQMKGTHRSAH